MKLKKNISYEKLSFIEFTEIKDDMRIKELDILLHSEDPLPDDVIVEYEDFGKVRYFETKFPEDIDADLSNYLIMECVKELRGQNEKIKTIKNCVIFFTVITTIYLIVSFFAAIFKLLGTFAA